MVSRGPRRMAFRSTSEVLLKQSPYIIFPEIVKYIQQCHQTKRTLPVFRNPLGLGFGSRALTEPRSLDHDACFKSQLEMPGVLESGALK